MRDLLDMCVISEVTRPRPTARMLTWLDTQEELSLFLSVITFGEPQKGISKLPTSRKRRQLSQWIDRDLTRPFTSMPFLSRYRSHLARENGACLSDFRVPSTWRYLDIAYCINL